MHIGFIGLGTMGGRIAANLQKAGHELVVHDVSRPAADVLLKSGARWADTAADVGRAAAVVFLSLPGPPQIESVIFGGGGLAEGLAKGAVVFDLSTNAPRKVREIHERLLERGAHFLDAPISGGPTGAASGKLAIWVGGEERHFQANMSILSVIGDDVQYIGPIGAASVAKLVHNSIGYALNSVMAEMFTTGVKAGVKPEVLFKAIRSGGLGRRRTFDQLPVHFLKGNYDPPNFALALAHKDVTLAAELAREVGVPTRLIQLVLEEMTEAKNQGWDQRDSRVVMHLQERRAGVSVLSDADALAEVLKSTN